MSKSSPADWKVAELGEIIESAVDGPFGSNLKTEHYVDEPGVRVIRLQNLGAGVFIDSDRAFISANHAAGLDRHRVRPGDLLVASLGDEAHPVARACQYPADGDPAIVKADCFRLRMSASRADPRFVRNVLNCPSTRTGLSALAQGVTRDRVNLASLKRFRLALPPLSEQRRIATILDKTDEAIRSTEQLIAKLEQAKQGLLHDLLTRGLNKSGHPRDPHRHPDQFKESILGRIPIDWSVLSVCEACSLVQDGTHLPPQRVSDGPLLLSVRNMVGGKFVQTDADTRIPWVFFRAMHGAWEIRLGDVLLAVVGATIGKTARVGELPPFTVQRSITVLRGKQEIVDNAFLLEILSTPQFQRQIWTAVNQTAQPGIYLAELRRLYLPVPPIDEQRQICERSAAVGRRRESADAELRKLRLLKQGLMDDLLTGRVRVNVREKISA
jgi:type I restriction enzyme, S subunit